MLMTDRKYRLPRIWSNNELKKISSLFTGDIVNVSGWNDQDKEGGRYKDYFSNASSYTITNYKGERGLSGLEDEIFLDLSNSLPKDLNDKFDLCFNHTTLEHIYDVRRAFNNICSMTKDAAIFVVPFSQPQHETAFYKDFWRFTPSCLHSLFQDNGFEILYEACSGYSNAGVYILAMGSKVPERWQNRLPIYEPLSEIGQSIGTTKINTVWRIIKNRFNNIRGR